jgi:NTP pyrophosphatase (non-canonical NTP hydrolase)
MNLSEYQREARNTACYPFLDNNLIYTVLGLNGEAGELANEIKKIQRDDGNVLDGRRKVKIIDELGDCLWYVAAVASELGVDLENVAQANLVKLNDRKSIIKL